MKPVESKPVLSIVLSMPDGAASPPTALNSILHQSLESIELICVVSKEACLDGLEMTDPRIRVVTTDLNTPGSLRNAGLSAADGTFLLFVDAEDYVPDYALEVLVNKAVKYKTDILRFSLLRSASDPLLEGAHTSDVSESLEHLRPGDFHRLLDFKEGSPLYTMSLDPKAALYRREFLLDHQLQFPEESEGSERLFVWKTWLMASRVMAVRDPALICPEKDPKVLDMIKTRLAVAEKLSDILKQSTLPLDEQKRIISRELDDLCTLISQTHENLPEEEISYHGIFSYVFKEKLRDLSKNSLSSVKTSSPKNTGLLKKRILHPKVSIVVPIYNVEDYLNEALHSLSTQSMRELEFICVNDGSTDGSLAILKEYAQFDHRIRILDGPNGGYGKAMNRGMDAAKGIYMGILEPDDYAGPHMFRDLYKAAVRYDADMVKSDFYQFTTNPDGSASEKRVRLSDQKSFYHTLFCPGEKQESFKSRKNTWTGLYRMEMLKRCKIRHNETPGASYQNNGFWFQTFCLAERAVFLDQAYYHYRWDNPDSSMHNPGKMYAVTEEFRFIEDFLKATPGLFEKYRAVFYAQKFNAMLVTCRRLDRCLQLEYLHHITDEFKDVLERAWIAESDMMSGIQWQILHEMTSDPDAYFNHLCVSVIMPVYNAEKYIHETLDTLLERSEIHFEVICVDDGSTDQTLSILHDYEKKDPRVRVFTQANGGAGTARNHGLQYASGEYLVFLDADDFFEPDMLRRVYDQAHFLKTDVTVFRSDRYVEATGRYISSLHTIRTSLLPAERPFAADDVPVGLFHAFMMWPWDKMYRADFVREHHLQFQEIRIANDLRFVFSCIAKAERISTVGTVLLHHRKYEGSLSGARSENWPCYYEALNGLRQQLKSWDLYERFEQDFINYSLYFCLWTLTTTQGDAYYKLYDRMKHVWLKDLGVLDHDPDYFYHEDEYLKLTQLLSHDPDAFLQRMLAASQENYDQLRRRKRDEIGVLKAQNRELTNRNQNLRSGRKRLSRENARLMEHETLLMEHEALLMENEALLKQNEEALLQKEKLHAQNEALLTHEKAALEQTRLEMEQQISKLKTRNRRLKRKSARLEEQLDSLKQSTALKIGRAILWLPGKIQSFFR